MAVISCRPPQEATGFATRDLFDFVAGTGMGGVVALAVGACGPRLDVGVLGATLERELPRVFARRDLRLRFAPLMLLFSDHIYNPAPLARVFRDVFGDDHVRRYVCVS